VRQSLSLIAYDLGNLWRRLLLTKKIEKWSPTSLQQWLVKTSGCLIKAPVLLAASGGEPPDTVTLGKHGAANRCAVGSGRIGEPPAKGGCLRNRLK